MAAACAAYDAVAHPLDTDAARQALVQCQERFHLFANCFANEIGSYDRWDDLNSVGQRRGQKWAGWVSVVQETLRNCRALIENVRGELFLCWQELVERASAGSISVRSIQVGRKFAAGTRSALESLAET
ncbi:MAG: hypothetical protein JOZ62_12810 [Acidobacteriaceae bacterium]|nr:hypothetical protein [Acidobacteriaceae bacterium]